jgi:hypothetical protein
VEDAFALVLGSLTLIGLPERGPLLGPNVSGSLITIPLFALIAVIVTGVLLVTLGAVKNPLFEMVPALADQVTAVSADPLMRAVNCICCSDGRVALPGESEILAESLEVEVEVPVVPL